MVAAGALKQLLAKVANLRALVVIDNLLDRIVNSIQRKFVHVEGLLQVGQTTLGLIVPVAEPCLTCFRSVASFIGRRNDTEKGSRMALMNCISSSAQLTCVKNAIG